MKKAFVLLGSYNDDGYTKKALNLFMDKAKKDYEFEVFNAFKTPVKPCIGCKNCEKNSFCIYDDFEHIDNALKTSDLLIVATPVYNLSFPAPLKAVFDRMQIYFNDRFTRNIKPPISKHKKSVLILTCGSDETTASNIIMTQLNMIFTIINATLTNTLILSHTDNNPDINTLIPKIDLILKDL